MIKFYDNTEPFKSIEEITSYQLTQVDRMKSKHQLLEGHGYYSIGTLTALSSYLVNARNRQQVRSCSEDYLL